MTPQRECPYCLGEVPLVAAKCRHCGEFLDGRRPPPTVVYTARPQLWSPVAALILSFFAPGLGQAYKGQVIAGIVWFFAVLIGYLAFILPGILLHLICLADAASGDPTR